MILEITILLFIILSLVLLIFSIKGGYILIVSVLKGLMLGAIYDKGDFEEENVTEHTIQISIFLICFTFIWETELN